MSLQSRPMIVLHSTLGLILTCQLRLHHLQGAVGGEDLVEPLNVQSGVEILLELNVQQTAEEIDHGVLVQSEHAGLGLGELVVGDVGEHVVLLHEVVWQAFLAQSALESPPNIQEFLPNILLCPVSRASFYQSERTELSDAVRIRIGSEGLMP